MGVEGTQITQNLAVLGKEENHVCREVVVATALTEKRKLKVLWPPLQARTCGSSFHVCYSYVTKFLNM